jgi:uncharacterized protein YjeT (DUF2065 family)
LIAYLCLALGLVFLVEGLVWALAPSFLERMLAMLRDLPLPARRQAGLLGMVTGAMLLWMANALGF